MSQLTVTVPTIHNCRYTGSPITLRVYYQRTFIDDQGNEVIGGAIGSQNFYEEVLCTLVGSNLTVPDLVLTTTDNPRAPLYAQIPVSAIFYQGTTQLDFLFQDFLLPFIFVPTVTLSDLTVWNDAVVITYPSRYFLDRNQILFLLRSNTAPINATYITQTPNSQLSNEQALSLLPTGMLKSTTGTGVLTIAIPGTDYMVPGPVGSQGVTMNTSRLLGRTSPGVGNVQEIQLGTNLSFTGNVLNATGGGGGASVNPTSDVMPVQRGGFFVDSNITNNAAGVLINLTAQGFSANNALTISSVLTHNVIGINSTVPVVTLIANQNISPQNIFLEGGITERRITLLAFGDASGTSQAQVRLNGISGAVEVTGTVSGTSTGQLNVTNVNGRQFRVIGFAGLYGELTLGSGGMFAMDAVSGSIEFNTAVGGDLIVPRVTVKENLGTLQKKYKTLHAAELWVETLVAQNTIATIGGRILVGPTTSLVLPLAAITGTDTIRVKHNQMSTGDVALMEAAGFTEFIGITSNATPVSVPPDTFYDYTVTRNLDGTGANTWNAGDAVFNTGKPGNGFIDLYSVYGLASFSETGPVYNEAGPTIAGNIRKSTTYNDWTEHWAIGNLKGLYGYSVNTYGVGLGEFIAGVPHITIDSQGSNLGGIRIFSGINTVIGQWDANGNITVGQVIAGKPNISITPSTLQLRTGTSQVRIELRSDGSGYLANTNISWNAAGDMTIASNAGIGGWVITPTAISSTGVQLISGAGAGIGFGTPPPIGPSLTDGIWIDRTGLYGSGGGIAQVAILAQASGGLLAGSMLAGAGKVVLDASGVRIKAPSSFSATQSYRFVADTGGVGPIVDGSILGAFYQTLFGATNALFLSAYVAGATSSLYLHALASAGNHADTRWGVGTGTSISSPTMTGYILQSDQQGLQIFTNSTLRFAIDLGTRSDIYGNLMFNILDDGTTYGLVFVRTLNPGAAMGLLGVNITGGITKLRMVIGGQTAGNPTGLVEFATTNFGNGQNCRFFLQSDTSQSYLGMHGTGGTFKGLVMAPDAATMVVPDSSTMAQFEGVNSGASQGYAVLFPRLTIAQRNTVAIVNGKVVFNTDTQKLQVCAAGAWVDLH